MVSISDIIDMISGNSRVKINDPNVLFDSIIEKLNKIDSLNIENHEALSDLTNEFKDKRKKTIGQQQML